MPRTNRKAELWSHLSQFGVWRLATATPGSSTLSVAPAAGAVSVTVVSSTNMADGDYLEIGSEEAQEIHRQNGAPAGNVITLRTPLAFAHAIGETVKEQALTNLGHITDDGVAFNWTAGDEAVMSSIRRQALGYLMGHVEGNFKVALEGFNLENMATALGMDDTSAGITGAGTGVSPYQFIMNPDNFRSQNNLAFEAQGVRKDGLVFAVEFCGVELDIGTMNLELKRGTVASIPIMGKCTSAVFWRNPA